MMSRFVSAITLVGALSACSVFRSTAPQRLIYEGYSTVVATNPTVVDAVVTVRNTGAAAVQMNSGLCVLHLEAYTNAAREGTPAWGSGMPACLALGLVTVEPGNTYDFKTRGTLPASLSPGVYYLALVGARGQDRIPVGRVTLP
ncbi:MAG: hypothetical protein H7Z74_06785 [Anaerolineae bacterium]|nr:hypothetical protein [Gemmatimonadaceae bacterium]